MIRARVLNSFFIYIIYVVSKRVYPFKKQRVFQKNCNGRKKTPDKGRALIAVYCFCTGEPQ